jgi:hypothetical protein
VPEPGIQMPSDKPCQDDSNDEDREEQADQEPTSGSTPKCGIIMPISAIDGCGDSHWAEVLQILDDTILESGFDPSLVSNADDVGLIHKRIIQNLYDNPIVVCDVSGKNPNVMFELGLRLAFDRPTIIIKDDKTSYSFDTAPIEHLEYPRDLRFAHIIAFKKTLSAKIKATYERSQKDKNFTTFLKHFGPFKVAKLDERIVSSDEYILDEIKGIRQLLLRSNRALTGRAVRNSSGSISSGSRSTISPVSDPKQIRINESFFFSNVDSMSEFCEDAKKEIDRIPGVLGCTIVKLADEIRIELTADKDKFEYPLYLESVHKKHQAIEYDRCE